MVSTTTRNIPSDLPDIEFVDTDTETLVNKLIAGYEVTTERTLYPADPIRAFILWVASIMIQERILINESAKQNVPRYAKGENLDSLNELFHNITRLEAKAATVTLGFTLSVATTEEYTITDEIEVTVDGLINFVTTENIIFKVGTNYAEVAAVCTQVGEIGNGFVNGQITKLVSDEFLYFQSVTNITESAGGSEEESDTAYYNRMRESEESYTTAGPKNSYIYHAKTVSTLISDVSANTPSDGVADIRIMLYGGKLPSDELIQKVQAYLSADDIRPMTDKVIVSAPGTVGFNIDITYYISSDKASSIKDIMAAVDTAVENYELWQTQKMGRDINPSYFNSMLMESGIKRVEIREPIFTAIPKGSVAVVGNHNVIYGGVEDE